MNTDKDLVYRLLRLIPVSELKLLVADSKGKNQLELIQEMQVSHSLDEVKKELVKQYGYLKQHVYTYKVSKAIKSDLIKKILEEHFINVGQKHFFFRKCTFTVKGIYEGSAKGKISNKLEVINIEFIQPCMVNIENGYLIVCFTILEKSINSYIPDYRIFETTIDFKEEDVLKDLESKLNGSISKADLNKGIKFLWERDIIDSKYVTYKKTSSLSREIMDEELTYKETYPTDYKEVIKAPLQKTTFRIKKNSSMFCDFVTIPSEGVVSFNKFPENLNQIENVISEIIKKN
ncbi:MAG: hypothetical protein PSV36_05910 [Algoriphagus sp.]|nr:hypothetical protein [Algoriphagus sp.]